MTLPLTMTPQHHLPADIERTSLSIITAELAELGLTPPPETAAVVKRVIHTTADFDYHHSLMSGMLGDIIRRRKAEQRTNRRAQKAQPLPWQTPSQAAVFAVFLYQSSQQFYHFPGEET